MKSQPVSAFPRSRTLVHPGPAGAVRIQTMQAPRARHVRLSLRPDCSLYDALVQPLTQLDINSAAVTVLGGQFATLDYCTPAANPAGPSVAKYSAPVHVERVFMVSATATLGTGADGEPLVHCHATLRTADGATKGGHILTEKSIIGAAPITALVTSFDTFGLQQVHDAETTMPLFLPQQHGDKLQ